MTTQAERRARRMEREYKIRRAVELARAGLPWDMVAEGAGYANGNSALRAVERYLARKRHDMDESAEHVRELELDRLDAMHSALWDRARRGETTATDSLLRIHDRRMKLDPRLAAIDTGQTREAIEAVARSDRDLAVMILDVMLALADRLEFTPEQRVKAPGALLAELAARKLVPEQDDTVDAMIVVGEIES